MKRVMPSPALLVAVIALVAALGGGAVAGVAVTSLNKKERKQVTKIAKKVANKRIDKRESKLSVKRAESANTANSATTAQTATNADSAKTADEATTATNADDATTANGVKPVRVAFVLEKGQSADLLDEGGLRVSVACDGSGAISGQTDLVGPGAFRLNDGSVTNFTSDAFGSGTILDGRISWWKEDGNTGSGQLNAASGSGSVCATYFGHFLIG